MNPYGTIPAFEHGSLTLVRFISSAALLGRLCQWSSICQFVCLVEFVDSAGASKRQRDSLLPFWLHVVQQIVFQRDSLLPFWVHVVQQIVFQQI